METNETKNEESTVTKKKNRIPIIIGIIVAVAALAVVARFFLVSGSEDNKLNDTLQLADNYLGDLDYENAIASYEQAISIDPKSVDAYAGLANTYIAMADDCVANNKYDDAITNLDNAMNAINRGLDNVDSDKADVLKNIQTSIEVNIEEVKIQETDSEKKIEVSKEDKKIETKSSNHKSEKKKEKESEVKDPEIEKEVKIEEEENTEIKNEQADNQEYVEPVVEEQNAEGTIEYVGQIITFGNFEQDGNHSNGKEPIEWIVLSINGDKALVISRYILDTLPYYQDGVDDNHIVTWSNSYLRYWMNNDFYNSAFSSQEQARIALTTLDNPNPNEFYDLKGKHTSYYNDYTASTQDRIFALSYKEVTAYMGVTQLTGSYWGYASPMLMTEATPDTLGGILINKELSADYYSANLSGTNYPSQNVGRCGQCWWLRSSGYRLWEPGDTSSDNSYTSTNYTSYALYVDMYGILGGMHNARCATDEYGDNPGDFPNGARPAMYIYF